MAVAQEISFRAVRIREIGTHRISSLVHGRSCRSCQFDRVVDQAIKRTVKQTIKQAVNQEIKQAAHRRLDP